MLTRNYKLNIIKVEIVLSNYIFVINNVEFLALKEEKIEN